MVGVPRLPMPLPPASGQWQSLNVLPYERDTGSGQLRPAMPKVLQDILNAISAPRNAMMGQYDQRLMLPSGSVSQFDPRMMTDAANLAGMVTLGAGAVPGAPGALRMGSGYFRRTRGANPDNGIGYMMFADDPYKISSYGKNLHLYDGTASIDATELVDLAKKFGFDQEFENGDDLLDLINPQNIVDSAGVWDNPDMVSWLWQNVLEPNGITAIRTKDGAVVFDPALVKSLGVVDPNE